MVEREYDRQLGTSGAEWLRIRFSTERGSVTNFTVQYETMIGDQVLPVIRYDCTHGFAHVDVLAPDGTQVSKRPMSEHLSLKQAMQLAIADLTENWETYRARFLGA
jgi:hypothetical protein